MTAIPVQLTLRARDRFNVSLNPTAVELAAALTFAHRVLNRMAAPEQDPASPGKSSFDALRAEPSAVNFEIESARDGSVVLAGIVAVVSDPFVQGVAGGIIANLTTPKLLDAVKKTKRLFSRPAKASVGRTVVIKLEVNASIAVIDVQFLDNGKITIGVQVS